MVSLQLTKPDTKVYRSEFLGSYYTNLITITG